MFRIRSLRFPLLIALASTGAILCVSPSAHAQSVELHGNDSLTVKNGDFYQYIDAYDSSQVNVTGGNVTIVSALDNTTVNVSGGTVGAIGGGENCHIQISGGTITSFYPQGQNVVTVTGGTFGLISIEDALSFTISGGTVSQLFAANGSGTITGGNLSFLATDFGGNLDLYGSGFTITNSYQGITSNAKYTFSGTFYTVIGTLQNNGASAAYTLFDAASRTDKTTGAITGSDGYFTLHDLGANTALILNAAAEPGSSLFLLSAAIPIALLVRRTRRS